MKASSRRLLRIAVERTFPRLVKKQWNFILAMLELVGRELKDWSVCAAPLWIRAGLWRRGFLSESYAIYGIKSLSETKPYLPDFHRYTRTASINGDHHVILDDKIVFFLVCRGYTDKVAPVIGLIDKGVFVSILPDQEYNFASAVEVLARISKPLVLKPVRGGGGGGIFFYEYNAGKHYLNHEPVGARTLEQNICKETYVVSPVVKHAQYCEKIFPNAPGTIRILTMWDYDHRRAFIAKAVHRFGTLSSGSVDNWAQGGLCAAIDLQTGTLGAAASFPKNGQIVWHQRHPDTGADIEGLRIPNWEMIKDEMTSLANSLPFLPYIGWDLIPTDDAFSIIEGNNRTGIETLQIHKPLLADGRIKKFYKYHNII